MNLIEPYGERIVVIYKSKDNECDNDSLYGTLIKVRFYGNDNFNSVVNIINSISYSEMEMFDDYIDVLLPPGWDAIKNIDKVIITDNSLNKRIMYDIKTKEIIIFKVIEPSIQFDKDINKCILDINYKGTLYNILTTDPDIGCPDDQFLFTKEFMDVYDKIVSFLNEFLDKYDYPLYYWENEQEKCEKALNMILSKYRK